MLGEYGWMIVTGVVLMLVAVLILRRTSRHDLKGAALESAWQTARGRRSGDNPTALDEKWREIEAEKSATGKVRRAAVIGASHFLAQVLGVIALVMLLIGAALAGLGFYWR